MYIEINVYANESRRLLSLSLSLEKKLILEFDSFFFFFEKELTLLPPETFARNFVLTSQLTRRSKGNK